jgi:hypothetical protein
MNNPISHEPDDRPEAVQQADTGAQAWRAVVHAQQPDALDHCDFYDLAGHLVDTLAAIEALARMLARQVARYADAQPAGQQVYDDTRTVDPRVRLHDAALDLGHLAEAAAHGRGDADRFWSAISHIGVEDAPTKSGPKPGPCDEVSR